MIGGNRRRRRMPELNTTSTADISFMLLTFFLVTTSMDSDKGLARQLPPQPRQEEQSAGSAVEVDKSNVMSIALDEADRLTVNGHAVTDDALTADAEKLISSRPAQHIIEVKTAPSTTYNAYFQMQNALMVAYNRVRDKQARKSFGHSLKECSRQEQESVLKQIPVRITEADPEAKGGSR